MNNQETAMKDALKSERMFWITLFFVFTRILFPIIKHSIKHRWIFAALGFIVPFAIHATLSINIDGFNQLLAISLYVILIPLGIYTTIYMRRRKRMKEARPTNPYAPEELYALYADEEHF